MENSAGLRHAPKGPAPVVQVKEDVSFVPQPSTQITPVKNIIFKLVNKSRGDVYLPLYAQNVKNPKTGQLDTIRVLKGVYTIWESEQKDLKYDAKQLAKSRRSVKFEFGSKDNIALVKADDLAVEAMRILPMNVEVEGANKGSRFAFYEIDTERQAKIDSEKRARRREAVRLAEGQTFDKLKKHATYLRIRVLDEYGYPKIERALRNEYEDYAELDPEKFIASCGSKEVEVAFLINKAISDAKIDTSTHKGSAYWSTGGFICRIPSTEKAYDYLVEFAMNTLNEDSKTFRQQLENIGT